MLPVDLHIVVAVVYRRPDQFAESLRDRIAGALVQDERNVVPENQVVITAAVDRVVAGAADHDVVVGAAVDYVIATEIHSSLGPLLEAHDYPHGGHPSAIMAP